MSPLKPNLNRIKVKNSRFYMLVCLLIAIVVLMVMLSKCSYRQPEVARIQTDRGKSGGDTLDVAIEISPLSYRVSGDSVIGLDYDILRTLSDMSGRPIKFHAFAPMTYAVEGLDSGYYDIVVSALPATETLKKKFNLSEPVYLDREVLVQLKGSENFITQPEQLGNDSVWIAHGSPFRQRIENLGSEIGEPIRIKSIKGYTAEHLVMLVAKGKIPRAVVNQGIARRMQQDYYPDLDISTPISFTQFQCWILAPDATNFVNTWLDSLKRTDLYDNILQRYGM